MLGYISGNSRMVSLEIDKLIILLYQYFNNISIIYFVDQKWRLKYCWKKMKIRRLKTCKDLMKIRFLEQMHTYKINYHLF